MYRKDKIIISPINTQLVIEGNIDSFVADELILQNDYIPKYLSSEQLVNIYIYNNYKGELKYIGKIIEILDDQIKLKVIEQIYTKQRRSEVRINVAIPVTIKQIYTKEETVFLDNPISGEIINLSAKGLLLGSTINIPDHIKFFVEFELEKGNFIEVVADIVRKEHRNKYYYYGCRLATVTNEEVNFIRSYIVKRQIIQRKNSTQNFLEKTPI